MKIVITGGTGFIGRHLVAHLSQRGYSCVALTRHTHLPDSMMGFIPWNGAHGGPWQKELHDAQAVVNLAGESVANRRWTAKQKAKILESRVNATRAIVNTLSQVEHTPPVLINASAIGYYGDHGDTPITEETPAGTDFLSNVAVAWEDAALAAEAYGTRVVRLRLGLVVGRGGGALKRMAPVFRYGLGGRLGHGKQWMSWVHVADVVGMITWAIEQSSVSGPMNVVSPEPVRNIEFTKTLGQVLHRSTDFPVPTPLLRLALGERAELMLRSQRVMPKKALQLGYQFHYADCATAIQESV